MSNLIRHKILKELHKVYFNNPHLPNDSFLSTVCKSLSFDDLKEKLLISDNKLKENLEFLVLNNEVDKHHKNSKNQYLNYKLNEIGLKTFYSKFYFNNTWFMNKTFVISIIAIIISLSSLCLNYYKDNSSTKKTSELENRIIQLEKKIEKLQ